MASLQEVINALRDTADKLEKRIPELLLEQEITAKSLVQDRIQETGKDSKGGTLGIYSNTKIPAFFFFGKGTKATDKKLQSLSKEGKKLSYADFRKLDGKQSNYVDLTFSGKMWKDTGLVKKEASKTNAVIVIGQKTERSEKVAGYMEDRYGNFLQLSQEEIDIITEDMTLEVEDIINANLSDL